MGGGWFSLSCISSSGLKDYGGAIIVCSRDEGEQVKQRIQKGLVIDHCFLFIVDYQTSLIREMFSGFILRYLTLACFVRGATNSCLALETCLPFVFYYCGTKVF